MKKNLLSISILGIIIFFMVNISKQPTVANENHELLKLVSVVEGEKVKITEWSFQGREKVKGIHNMDDLEKYTELLKKKFSNWDWMVSYDSSRWEALATKVSSGKMQERIQILSTPTKTNPQTYIIYEAKGENFNKENEQFINEELTGTLSDIFRGNTTFFSCIKGDINGKMNTTLPITVNHLLTVFQAKEIESLAEKNFISTSANSALFMNTIKSRDKDINLQIGLRTNGLGSKTTLVIGTPIITIEY
jgi:hypothetical protein